MKKASNSPSVHKIHVVHLLDIKVYIHRLLLLYIEQYTFSFNQKLPTVLMNFNFQRGKKII
jgi:hypothetical protein